MFQIGIQVEINTSTVDSDIQQLLSTRSFIYESQLKERRKRKKCPFTLQEHLNSKVPGRQKQNKLLSMYIDNVSKGEKAPLCLHGSTGCGKTSIMNQMIAYLEKQNPEYQIVYLNCLNFTTIRQIYSALLWEVFQKKDKKPEQILSYLFSTS